MEGEMPSKQDSAGILNLHVEQTGSRGRGPVFSELEVVRLARDFQSKAAVIPSGTEATVLQVFDGGHAYQVEFEGPYEAPETVLASDLEAPIAHSA